MAQQLINLGNADQGNGDPIRSAFNKVNENFTELYEALGLDSGGLNLGSFEFVDNRMMTTDSSQIILEQDVTLRSNLTVDGDIIGYVKLAVLKDIVASSSSFSDFQTRISNL